MGDKTAKASGDRGTVMVLALCCIALSLGVYKGLSWAAGRSADAELRSEAPDAGGDGAEAFSAESERLRDASAWVAAGLGAVVFAMTAGLHVKGSRAGDDLAEAESG